MTEDSRSFLLSVAAVVAVIALFGGGMLLGSSLAGDAPETVAPSATASPTVATATPSATPTETSASVLTTPAIYEPWRKLQDGHAARYHQLGASAPSDVWSMVESIFAAPTRPGFFAIGCAESDLTADAVGRLNHDGSQDFGAFQINSRYFDGTWARFPEEAKTNAVANARVAIVIYEDREKYDGNGFEPWATWQGSPAATLVFAQAHGNCIGRALPMAA